MFKPIAYAILGLPFHAVTTDEAEEFIRESIRNRRRCFLSTPNLNFLATARSDPAFRQSVLESDLSVADGMPLIWLARLLGVPLPERVAGSTLFERLRRSTGQAPIRVFFFGGAPGVAELASQRLNDQACGMTAVGFHDPGMGDIASMSSPAIIDQINSCNPDFLVIALGAKKGQAWIQYNKFRLNALVISHLGAVINFAAGTVSRAPTWMQNSGLEWLWRIKEESQLVNRYLKDGLWLLGVTIAMVLPLIIRTQLDFSKHQAISKIQHGEKVIILTGNWRDSELELLTHTFNPHRDENFFPTHTIDLTNLNSISPAIAAKLIIILESQSKNDPIIYWPKISNLAFAQLQANNFLSLRGNINCPNIK